MSDFLRWRASLALGLPEIDSQHRALASLINRLAHASSGAEIRELLERLHQRAHEHFESEEAFMRSFDYTEFAEHQREHTMLLGELKCFIHQVELGIERLDEEALQELKVWFVAHLRGSDRPMANAYHRATKQRKR
jgi:hemerythrin-like metal-binding protein